MRANGKECGDPAGLTLGQWLSQHGYAAERIAVERNGRIVRRQDLAATELRPDDILEIVSFVGGG